MEAGDIVRDSCGIYYLVGEGFEHDGVEYVIVRALRKAGNTWYFSQANNYSDEGDLLADQQGIEIIEKNVDIKKIKTV